MVNKLSDHLQATLSFYVVGTFIGLIILGLIIHSFKQRSKVIKSLQYLSVLHIIFWVLHHLIFVFVYTRYALKGWIFKSKEPVLWYTYVCLLNLTTVLAQCSMYTIMLARLYYTFKGSVHELNDYVIIIFLILIFIASFLLLFGLWVFNGVFDDLFSLSVKRAEFMGSKIYISASGLFVGIGLLLIYLFAKKLISLVSFTSMNKTQTRLFRLAIKNSLLCFIGIASFNAYLIIWMLLGLNVIELDPWDDNDAWKYLYITYFNQVITVAIEMICMYLSLGSASKLYDKCCKPCHYVCQYVIVKLVRICCHNVNFIKGDQMLLSRSNVELENAPDSPKNATSTEMTTLYGTEV